MSKYNLPDPRNENTLVYVNGLVPRREAKVSVLDSVVQGGDAVWEGLRVYNSKIYQLEEHLDRLFDSAHVLQFENIPSRSEIRNAIFGTLKANNMSDGVHIRLTLSRGVKSTSGMNPQLNIYGCTLIILPEYKGLVYGEDGLKLITSSIRRNAPYSLDSKIHHNNLINNILAKIEANHAGVDDAVMLDQNGFIAETNATNIFLVRKGELLTPFADACLPGLTRERVLEIAAELGIKAREKNLSMTEMYTADEMFTTGTMGALSWVKNVDGRQIGKAEKGPLCQQIQAYYQAKIDDLAVAIP
ncbi:aminotransferase class IV [Croceimicrobium hydrocarbonivorans]|uniref:branched-chain-amino-acid transaminase n=1 Tax=Croceimicrobium hydrocarbonivorans TaxID=2761580 RepID=A0A7H0VCJ7_9FLAO|nr:aminotransferase class IV [Croceimicrobium hydrocarbonivorans]QNR23445.1 aminotransferase class IV [Croceimicrobium hydrocarbonivorans]